MERGEGAASFPTRWSQMIPAAKGVVCDRLQLGYSIDDRTVNREKGKRHKWLSLWRLCLVSREGLEPSTL